MTMFERALYYPNIDIPNFGWLKSAILFWDRIETIVPESIDHPYNRKLTRALEGEGILFAHRVNPFNDVIRGLERDVETYLNTSEGKKSFRKPWLVSSAQNSNRLDDLRFWEKRDDMLREKYQEFYIHLDKLPLPLRNELAGQQDEGGFVRAREGFMNFYMTLLANRICQVDNMALLTGAVTYNNLSNKILRDKISSTQGNLENEQARRGMMYQIVMDDIKIAPSTPVEDIIRFRRDRQQELARFREEMDRLTDFDLEGMNAQDFEHELKRIYDQEIIPAMNNVKTTLNESRINWLSGPAAWVFGGLSIAFGMGADVGTNIAIGVCEGMSLTLTALPQIYRWHEMRNSPYTYLVKAHQSFSRTGRKAKE